MLFLPESKGESREGVDRGEDFKAEETARDVEATECPLLEDPIDPIFLGDFIREAKLSFSLVVGGGGCCLACWRHLARRFLNQTWIIKASIKTFFDTIWFIVSGGKKSPKNIWTLTPSYKEKLIDFTKML